MTIEQRIAHNQKVINRGMSTLTRTTNPAHIFAAHGRIDRAENNISRLKEESEKSN